MMSGSEAVRMTGSMGQLVQWQGQSGRIYRLDHESLDGFSMHDSDLYLVAKGGNALWVGSTDELVSEPMSRARFRLALNCADRVFRLSAGAEFHSRLATISDLENAKPLPETSAQAA